MNRRVANRYALALIHLAEERGALDVIAQDLREIEATIHGSRELHVVLLNPVVTPDRKLKLLTELFGKRFDVITMSFIALLTNKGRAEYLLAAAEEYNTMLDAKRGIVSATVTSAATLTDSEKAVIQGKLESMTGKQIRPRFDLDPSLRGGFMARIGDRMVDASLRNQLELLREQFKRGGAPVLN